MGQKIHYNIPPVLTRKQLQETMHISKTTALRLIKEKEIPASRVGNKYLVQREDVLDFLERCRISASGREYERGSTEDMGKDIERIYQRFEDANDFTGSDRRKRYGKEEYRALEEYFMRHYPGNSDELLDQVNACITEAVEEAFLEGFCFGIKLLIGCIL